MNSRLGAYKSPGAMEDGYDFLQDFNAIDAAIIKHRSIVQRLCTLRNSHLPIWRVPDEVLSRIFLFMVSEHFYHYFDKHGYGPDHPYKWTQIISVCRRWHRVCFTTRELWAFVDLRNPVRTRTLLQLSGRAPLIIISTSFEENALHLCLAEMSRIRHFLFKVPDPLEYLDGENGVPHLPPITGVCNVLSLHLHLATPAFTRLFVSSSLTRLRCVGPMNTQFSVDEMLAVLDSVPHLVDLELVSALKYIDSPHSHNAVPDRKAVALPALRHMELQDSSDAGVSCSVLLQFLELPVQASLSLNFSPIDDYRQKVADVIDSLRRVASKIFGRDNLPRTCRIDREDRTYLTGFGESNVMLELWPTVHHISELQDFSNAPSEIGHVTITLGNLAHRNEGAPIHAFLSTIPLSKVSTLTAYLPTFPPDIWTQFAGIANPTQVSAAPHALAYGLLEAFATSSGPAFTKLEALALGDIRWDKGLPGPNGSDVPLSQRCRDALEARMARGGASLRSLVLRGATGVDEAALMAIRDLGCVDKLECGSGGARKRALHRVPDRPDSPTLRDGEFLLMDIM